MRRLLRRRRILRLALHLSTIFPTSDVRSPRAPNVVVKKKEESPADGSLRERPGFDDHDDDRSTG